MSMAAERPVIYAGGGILKARAAEGPAAALPGAAHVARLNVEGVIGDDRKVIEALDRVRKDPASRAVVVAIDSPGGSAGGGEALYAALNRVRGSGKPVVAVLRGTAASAG